MSIGNFVWIVRCLLMQLRIRESRIINRYSNKTKQNRSKRYQLFKFSNRILLQCSMFSQIIWKSELLFSILGFIESELCILNALFSFYIHVSYKTYIKTDLPISLFYGSRTNFKLQCCVCGLDEFCVAWKIQRNIFYLYIIKQIEIDFKFWIKNLYIYYLLRRRIYFLLYR